MLIKSMPLKDNNYKDKTEKEAISIIVIRFILTVLLGLCAAYLINKMGKKNDAEFDYFWFVFIFFSLMGFTTFIINLIKIKKEK